MAGTSGWQRLGEHIVDRMEELNIDQADLVARSRLSQPTVSALMGGEPRATAPRPKTLRLLEDGLGWQRGSVGVILAGGEPDVAPQTGSGGATPSVDLADRVARLEAVVRQILEEMARSDSANAEELGRLADRLEAGRQGRRTVD